MLDHSMIQGLPDEELASAVKNPSGVIPGWLALATLQQRNTLRQSAPVAPPQGTVADNVVGQALRSAGFHPQGQEIPSQQQPQQPQQQPPQGAGIMAQQSQGMAKGGIVGMADGGSTGSYADLLQQAGILAPLSTITPQQTTYDPGYKPDATDLQGAQAKVAPLYGKGPDYAATLADIDALRKQSEASSHVGVGQFLTNLVGGIMGSKGNATQGFGEALSNESTLERNLKQQNIANQQKLVTDKANILGIQDERQQKIAGAAERYQSLNAQIADTQARAKLANDSGNADRVEAAQKTNATLQEARSRTLSEAMKNASENPLYASAIANQLDQQGNKAGAALYRDAAAQYMTQKKAEADIISSRQLALEKATAGDALNRLRVEHGFKMQEQSAANAPGVGGETPLEAEAKMIAEGKLPPPSPMSLTRPQAAALMAKVHEFNPDYDSKNYSALQDLRKQSLPNGKIGQVATAGNTAINHLETLGKAADALQNGNAQLFNQIKQNWAQSTGQPEPTNFDALKHQVSGELVSVLKKNGIADQHSIEAIQSTLDRAKSPQQIQGAINENLKILGGKMAEVQEQVKKTPGIAKDDPVLNQIGYSDNAKRVLYHRGFDPENVTAGSTLGGLPGGGGKPLTPEVMDKFAKAAGGDKQKAMRYAYEFGWR